MVDDEARKWLGRIKYAQHYQEKYGNIRKRWATYAKALACDFGNATIEGAVDLNLVRPTVKNEAAPLHTTDIYLTVRPTRQTVEIRGQMVDNTENARFTEVEQNYWQRELRIREKVLRPCVYDAQTTNHMYALVGYVDAENEHLVNKTDSEGDPRGRVEWNPLIKVDAPFVRRLPPRLVLVPPGRCDLDENPYIFIGWRLPKHVVQAQFPGADLSDLQPTLDPLEFSDEDKPEDPLVREYMEGDDHKLVQLWQAWDQENMEMLTLADGFDRVIEKGDWPWKPEGFPVAHAHLEDVPDEYYGSPPIETYWPQQVELNFARTASKKRNNVTKAVIFVKAGEMADAVKRAYEEASDGAVISIPLEDEQKLSDVLQVVPPLPAPNEAYADGRVQIEDIMLLSGQGQQQRFGGDPNIDTATASAIVDKWQLVRASDTGSRTKDFILDIHRKLWAVLKQFPDKKRERSIVGPIGARALTLRYTLERIHGEFQFDFDVGALMGENPIRRQQLALANYNLFRQDPRCDPEQLILDVIDSQGKVDASRYLFSRDPEQEIQTMLRTMPAEADLRDDHEAHMRQHRAQAMQLSEEIDALPDQLVDDQQGFRLRMVLGLLMAHMNQHAEMVQRITGKPYQAPGQPVDENQLRATARAGGQGGETAAETAGRPAGGVRPGTLAGLGEQV